MHAHLRRELRNLLDLFTPVPLRDGEEYSRRDLLPDIIAGLTVAVVLIPQAMALALIAGLPAIYGLYAAFPGFIASFFGSSRHLSTGPVAIVSFLTLTSLVPFADPGSPEFIALAALLALLVGLIQLLMGTLRLGFVVNLIPHSAIVGFSTAAAAIIIITQIPTLFGYAITQHDLVIQTIFEIIMGAPRTSLITLALGLSALGMLIFLRKLPKTFPAALVVLAGSVLVAYLFDLKSFGVEFIAAVPASLPSFALPALSAGAFFALLPKAAIVALVGFVEAHAIAKSVAKQTGQRLDTNQELVGQGLANTVSSFFHGYPVSGSFSRTAINMQAGARTGVAALVTSAVTVFALLFLTPIFHFLPKAVLAAIVIVSALPLVNYHKLRETYAISNTDGVIAYTTAALALILKPDDAIFIGIVLALILFLRRTVWGAKIVEMGVNREWNILRASDGDDRVDTYPNVLIARIGMSLYYVNATHIIEQLDRLVRERHEQSPVRAVVVDFSGVNFIDITGIEALDDYVKRLRERGISFATIYMRNSVVAALRNVPELHRITILHNIAEMKEYCMPHERRLVLGGTTPEIIGKK